jgi:hypothetical protein
VRLSPPPFLPCPYFSSPLSLVLPVPVAPPNSVVTVYRGRWRNLDVAIKTVLFSYQADNGGDPTVESLCPKKGEKPSDQKLFNQKEHAILEAAVCMSVSHPNLITTYHFDVMPMMADSGSSKSCGRGIGGTQIDEGKNAGSSYKLYLIQEYCPASLQV